MTLSASQRKSWPRRIRCETRSSSTIFRANVWSHYAVLGEYEYYTYYLYCVRTRSAGAAERGRCYSFYVTVVTIDAERRCRATVGAMSHVNHSVTLEAFAYGYTLAQVDSAWLSSAVDGVLLLYVLSVQVVGG